MGIHYIYVDSVDRTSDQLISDFTLNLHQPIANVTKIGVSSFTSSHNSHNITEYNNRVYWLEQKVEYIDTVGAYMTRLMLIELEIGYYTIHQLASRIIDLMNAETASLTTDAAGGPLARKFNTEALPVYSYSINEQYQISIEAKSSSSAQGNKFWGFYAPLKNLAQNCIVSILGFEAISQVSIDSDITGTTKQLFKTSISSDAIALRTLKAKSSYSENNSLMYLASKDLSSNAIISKNTGDLIMTTIRSSILETIQLNVSRYSYIHVQKYGSDILYHDYHGTLSHFSLQLLDQHYNINKEGVQNYRVALVVHTSDPSNEENAYMNKLYDLESYRIAHRL
jgi:hypothetical protein